MVLLLFALLLLLDLGQTQPLAKPGQGRPTVKQGLKILWLTYNFLTKDDQAMFLSAILPPYLGALFRSTKLAKQEKNTKLKTIMPYPRVG